MNKHVAGVLFVTIAGIGIFAVGGCSSPSSEPGAASTDAARPAPAAPDPAAVQPVALPELSASTVSETVRDQIRQQYAALMEAIDDPDAEPAALSRAYGEMGKLLLAAEFAGEAQTCFRNAQALAPRERRWPYYLGHVYRTMGDPGRAAELFERARQLEPNDVPTLAWLAEMYLETGDPGEASTMLEFALALRPDSLALQFGLGRAAIAREDYFRAIQHLEAALAVNPAATSIHTTLATAYRSIGEMEAAEVYLQQRRLAERAGADLDAGVIVRPADPLMDEVEELIRSAAAYELRGSRALGRGDYREAAARFRSGLELQPDNLSLRHKLGTVLAVRGDTAGSRAQFEEIVRRSPEYARAHYSLGVLLENSGEFLQALARYTSAVRHDPSYAEARLQLAGLLRRSERVDDAMGQYERIMEIDPLMFEAPFGYAMALVTQNRWVEARDRLSDGMRQFPGPPAFPLALARVLAAAPDERVRNGRRALEIMEQMPEEQQRVDFGETLAMALAENGRYREAAALQREAISAAPDELAVRMAANLKLYEAGEPSRTPWRDGEVP